MIQTESTPNPNSLKFLSEKVISAIGTEEFQREKSKDLKNKFVKELLEFKGVELVLLSKNFLSVKKTDDVTWNELKPMVISHLNHYFEKNDEPILKEKTESNITKDENDETVKKILDVLSSQGLTAASKKPPGYSRFHSSKLEGGRQAPGGLKSQMFFFSKNTTIFLKM